MMLTCFRDNRWKALVLTAALILPAAGCAGKTAPLFDIGAGTIEAEECLIKSSKKVRNSDLSGGKGVEIPVKEGSMVSFSYDISAASHYDISISYDNQGEDGTLGLFVDGHFFTKVGFPKGAGTVKETITLKEGNGEISFRHLPGDSDITLDCFKLDKSDKKISMVVAPHEDDEILGFAGSIQKTVANGDIVKVVLLTNGDYFDKDLGPIRIRETMKALEVLGVNKSNIYVMGYGDIIIQSLYECSDPGIVFDAPSGYDSTYGDPSSNLYDYHTLDAGTPAKYCYADFRSDLNNIIDTVRPDTVYTTSEAEWHPDHKFGFKAVRDVIESLNKEKGYHTTLCESVIHGEELTWPDKLETDDNGNIKIVEFTDPFPSGGAGRDWEKVTKITLTDEEVYKKQKAIDQFDTQNNGGANFNGNSEFNYAFCKRDEFYWVYVY